MARICEICGKCARVGHNVSHANNKTKRYWFANLQKVRVQTEHGAKSMRVCTQCIKSGRIKKRVA
jgi:large subunit ribosomal protein L28